ncbi:amidase family protein [Streptomyces niveus]|uniref:amidase family protein n=1 Tax=Streptomyces niveus TaxID=193462 RepID=UPI0036C47C42
MTTYPRSAPRAPYVDQWPESGPPYDQWVGPTPPQVAVTALRQGFALSVGDAERYAALGTAFAGAHERAARAWLAARPVPAPLPSAPGTDPLNAIAHELNLHGAAEGPLSGVRIALKGTISAAPGAPIEAGSLLVAGHRAPAAATVATRALDAGATILATGRTDNLCLAISGDTGAYGPVLNPWNRDHTTWGSSAGPAALVAAGKAEAAVLVDQAGSGRMPAAGTGLPSFLPTAGRIPMTGILGFLPLLDRVAVAARRVETIALLASAISGGDGRDRLQGPYCPQADWTADLVGDVQGLRVGIIKEAVTTGPDGQCDEAVAEAVYRRAADLAALGADIYEVSIPEYTLAADVVMLLTVHGGVPGLLATQLGTSPTVADGDPRLVRQFAERRSAHPQWMAQTVQVSAAVAGHDGGQPPGYWLAVAQALLPVITDAFDTLFTGPDRVGALLGPTAHSTSPSLTADLTPDQRLGRALGPGIRHTCPANLTGHPVMQIPAGLVDGLPVGVQLTAPHMEEGRLFRAALALQPDGGYPAAPTPHHEETQT